uniref:Alpha-tocopherol transfer protein n=1 Tax=Cacopsylla melanoneura TaxID=428564 RepID=A0A8D8SHC4_9HEMI
MESPLMQGVHDETLRKQIAAAINETDDDKLEHNKQLLEAWFRTQDHLPQDYDRRILTGFVRGCKHNLDVAKRKLDRYFTIRTTQTEFFQDRDPLSNEIQGMLNSIIIAPISSLSPTGCRIIYFQFTSDVEAFDTVAVFKAILMMSDIRIIEEPMLRGDIFVWDLQHLTLKHITKIAGPPLKKIMQNAQEAYPQMLQEIHIVNCGQLADRAADIVKLLMKPKMRNRFQFHADATSLSSCFPPEFIPTEYGGSAPSIHDTFRSWQHKMSEYTEWFKQQQDVKTDETKRIIPIESKENNMEGSFRKIAID